MENVNSTDRPDSDCIKRMRAIDDTLHIVGGKWTLPILAYLCYRPRRYSELLKDITGITGKVLSRELKDLELNGLVNRLVSSEQPVSVTYELTKFGKSLKELTDNLADWGLEHRARIFNASKQNIPVQA
jgi:DNA-binding HxlR family transcriptional regulator